jgi:hypothetical protein
MRLRSLEHELAAVWRDVEVPGFEVWGKVGELTLSPCLHVIRWEHLQWARCARCTGELLAIGLSQAG